MYPLDHDGSPSRHLSFPYRKSAISSWISEPNIQPYSLLHRQVPQRSSDTCCFPGYIFLDYILDSWTELERTWEVLCIRGRSCPVRAEWSEYWSACRLRVPSGRDGCLSYSDHNHSIYALLRFPDQPQTNTWCNRLDGLHLTLQVWLRRAHAKWVPRLGYKLHGLWSQQLWLRAMRPLRWHELHWPVVVQLRYALYNDYNIQSVSCSSPATVRYKNWIINN